MNTAHHARERFLQLMADVARACGWTDLKAEALFGLEFESDEMLTSVLPHPRDAGQLIVEVSLATVDLGELSADALLLLHQINDRARREHDWVIGIDENLVLAISCVRTTDTLDAMALQSLMTDGIERARALRGVWQAAQLDPEPGQTRQNLGPGTQAQTGLIRG